jgi:cytochrome c1
VKNPQAMKPETRMPALGLSDADAKAVTMYLGTLRAPKPDAPTEKTEAPATKAEAPAEKTGK